MLLGCELLSPYQGTHKSEIKLRQQVGLQAIDGANDYAEDKGGRGFLKDYIQQQFVLPSAMYIHIETPQPLHGPSIRRAGQSKDER